MERKKIIWIILFVVGIISFLIPLMSGIYDAVNGFSGLCFAGCDYYYGFNAFVDSIYLYSFIFWPTYIVGILLIVLAIINLKRKK